MIKEEKYIIELKIRNSKGEVCGETSKIFNQSQVDKIYQLIQSMDNIQKCVKSIKITTK